ncbi:MAG TPA: metallophosphoesterase [Blastocatellia bacterium]|nr:metallophosphoesterase [Blastocatellia bacterium]
MKRILLIAIVIAAVSAVTLLAIGNAQQQRPRQERGQRQDGGRRTQDNGEARTDVPAHPWDIILGRPTRDSITLSVLAYQPMEGFIEYETGKTKNKTAVQSFKPGEPVEIVIKGLKPDAQYAYRFHARANSSDKFTASADYGFHTARPAGAAFTFTVQSDSHLDYNTSPELYARTLANALADKPDFHFELGDTFMTDKYANYQDAAKQYLAQRYYFGLLCHSAPLFFALGNHDGERGRSLNGTANNMTVWSATMRKRYLPNPQPDAFYSGNAKPQPFVGLLQDYYSWEWGDALFVVLDPFWFTKDRGNDDNWARTLGEEQYQWLRKTLAGSKARFKFVFLHHLVGGIDRSARGGIAAAKLYEWGGQNADGSDGFKQHRPGWEMPIHQLLVKHRVSAVFHGHDHLFAKEDLDGIVYQEVPQPGNPRFNQPSNAMEYGYGTGTLFGSPGYLRVTVVPGKVNVELVRPVLAKDETSTRKNGQVDHRFDILPVATRR